MAAKQRVKIRKYMGDDIYSWAVFVDGQPVLTGESRRVAQYERDRLIKELEGLED